MNNGRFPLIIDVKPWFRDHSFGGRIVLPAVEAMLLLAAHMLETCPGIDIRVMEDACFTKFLEIPPDTVTLSALVECAENPDGRVRARLLSRRQYRFMSRIKEHCEIVFCSAEPNILEKLPDINFTVAPPAGTETLVEVDYLYRELVPFGPNYRTLQETLYLSRYEAWGKLRAPAFPLLAMDASQKIIGSPFPLDGALHAACVLGQRTVDFVPFPVGFGRRTVIRPTRPGASYITRVRQTSHTDDQLVFDLAIWDNDGQLCEMVTGLRMRDVSSVFKTD